MIAITIDGYSLSTIIVLAALVVVLARLLVRAMRDHGIRVTRFGFFIERERFDEKKPDVHHVVPEDENTKIEWPQREEEEP